MKSKTDTIQAYLDATGILEHGTPEEIEAARKEYWRIYKRRWKQERRKTSRSFTVFFTKAECAVISKAAQQNTTSNTAFIKAAALAQASNQSFSIHPLLLLEIRQLLIQNHTALEELRESTSSGRASLELMKRLTDTVNTLITKTL